MPDPDKPSPSSGFGPLPTPAKPDSPARSTDAPPTAGITAPNVPPPVTGDVPGTASIGPAPVSPGPPTVSGSDSKLDPSGPLDPPHFLGGRADNTNPREGYGHPASLVRPQDEHPTLEAQKFRVCHAGVGGFVKDEVITGLQIGSQVAIDRLTAAGAITPAG